ncbi:hypothetical protein ACFQ6N_01430 [Kitasatospora sp. NPDC056446]
MSPDQAPSLDPAPSVQPAQPDPHVKQGVDIPVSVRNLIENGRTG